MIEHTSITTFSLQDLEAMAQALYRLKDRCKIYAFKGTLGAGKTTLAQRLLRQFGVQGVITSPTFTYVNVYTTAEGSVLYHFDLYRINSVDAFIMSGFNEYLYQPNSWAIIEWPEVIAPLIDHQVCDIDLLYMDETTRQIKVKVVD